MSGIVRVFETLDTRMEIYVDWGADDEHDELVLSLRDHDDEVDTTIRLQMRDLHEVIESMSNFRTSMGEVETMRNLARFHSSKRELP